MVAPFPREPARHGLRCSALSLCFEKNNGKPQDSEWYRHNVEAKRTAYRVHLRFRQLYRIFGPRSGGDFASARGICRHWTKRLYGV